MYGVIVTGESLQAQCCAGYLSRAGYEVHCTGRRAPLSPLSSRDRSISKGGQRGNPLDELFADLLPQNVFTSSRGAGEGERAGAAGKQDSCHHLWHEDPCEMEERLGETLVRAANEIENVRVLVNCEEQSYAGALEETLAAEMDAQFRAGVLSVHCAVRAMLPVLKAQPWGLVVNVAPPEGGSGGALAGAKDMAACALREMTSTLGREVGSAGVEVALAEALPRGQVELAPTRLARTSRAYWSEMKRRLRENARLREEDGLREEDSFRSKGAGPRSRDADRKSEGLGRIVEDLIARHLAYKNEGRCRAESGGAEGGGDACRSAAVGRAALAHQGLADFEGPWRSDERARLLEALDTHEASYLGAREAPAVWVCVKRRFAGKNLFTANRSSQGHLYAAENAEALARKVVRLTYHRACQSDLATPSEPAAPLYLARQRRPSLRS